jgi:hypothetical protein
MRFASQGEHETRAIGAPHGWDPAKDGECGVLSVHDTVDNRGHPQMISRWELEEGDLEKLQAGAPVYLSILGQVHPVVCVYVGEPPQPAESERGEHQLTDAAAGTNIITGKEA